MSDNSSYTPFAQLSDSDRGPWIIVTTYILLIISCLAVSVKLWTRLATTSALIPTDWVMLGGMIVAIVQAASMTIAVHRGLGRKSADLSVVQLEEVSKAFYAANLLTIVVLAATKSSVILLMVSIQPLRFVMLGCYSLLFIIITWCIAGVLALVFQCELPKTWALGDKQTCVNQFALQVGLGTVNIITDLAIVALAVFLMSGVQTDLHKKLTVTALFGLRAAIPPFAICALVAYHTYYFSSPQDRTWHAVGPVLWTQVMLHLSIVTACIPSIKRFFMEVQSGLMGVTISEQYEMTHSGGKSTQRQSASNSRLSSRLATILAPSSARNHNKSGTGYSQHGETDGPYTNMAGSQYGNMARVRTGNRQGKASETESITGLTQDTIIHRLDYEVEFEEREASLR